MTSQVTGNQVNLSWSAPSGNTASSYLVEAGSACGASDVVVLGTGSASTTLSTSAPNGRYFVRVRGRNAAGTGDAFKTALTTESSKFEFPEL